MRKKKAAQERIVLGDTTELGFSPFAALGSVQAEVGQVEADPQPAPQKGAPFRIARTRKGGWPIRVEKRAKGKQVTVIRGLSGDLDHVLKKLKKLCGAGGLIREDSVELQGNHCDRIIAWFEQQ